MIPVIILKRPKSAMKFYILFICLLFVNELLADPTLEINPDIIICAGETTSLTPTEIDFDGNEFDSFCWTSNLNNSSIDPSTANEQIAVVYQRGAIIK